MVKLSEDGRAPQVLGSMILASVAALTIRFPDARLRSFTSALRSSAAGI
jgi:hypothetical protein